MDSNQTMKEKRLMSLTLNPFMGKKQVWDMLLGLPLTHRQKTWDSYGEFFGDNTRSYYMTGKFGFQGYWHCGRVPDMKFHEALHFAHEECDIKEKWKRMTLWNHFYEYDDSKLRNIQKTTKSERARHTIAELLKLNNRLKHARSKPTTWEKRIKQKKKHPNQTQLVRKADS